MALAPDHLGPTITVGEILVEFMATSVGDGFREPIDLVGPFASGAPAIFTDQCARIGGSAAIVGAVGADDFGRLNVNRLARDGADVSAIAVDPDYPTGSAFVRYRADGSRDFVYNIATSAAARFGWSEAVEALVSKAGHLHVMGSALSMPSAVAVIDRAVRVVKDRGGSLSFDPNLRKELRYDEATERRFAELVAMADLLLPSGEELERAAGVTGREAAIGTLLSMGIPEIALKEGARGASVFTPGAEPLHVAAFAVTEIDPTGAGDCFGGAYVACRRLGSSIEEALTYGCAAGARNVTVRGPMEGAGTRAELEAFIAATGRAAP